MVLVLNEYHHIVHNIYNKHMTKAQIKSSVKNLNGKNIHVETRDGRAFTGHLNLAGDALILTKEEYLVDITDVSSIREV